MSDKVIKCEAVYKIFGVGAKKMLQDVSGNVDAKTFQEAGCIVGVNNASFEVSKGEMLVVMGLSGSGKSTLLRCISRLKLSETLWADMILLITLVPQNTMKIWVTSVI